VVSTVVYVYTDLHWTLHERQRRTAAGRFKYTTDAMHPGGFASLSVPQLIVLMLVALLLFGPRMSGRG
jgi:hypothetical protein